jgi:hypothetical protein
MRDLGNFCDVENSKSDCISVLQETNLSLATERFEPSPHLVSRHAIQNLGVINLILSFDLFERI